MARRSPWFSLESDNDEIDLEQDVLGTDTELDETAVKNAGEDTKTVDVTPDKSETAHNEVASAGGVATGNNQDELEMDPVAATESFCRKFLGLSREDMEEAVDEIKDEVVDTTDETTTDDGNDDEMNDVLVEDSGEVVDADDTGVDTPAIDEETTVTVTEDTEAPITTTEEEEEEAMENWFKSLEEVEPVADNPQGDDVGPNEDKDKDKEDDNESSEFWM